MNVNLIQRERVIPLCNPLAWIQKKTKPVMKKYHQLLSVYRDQIFFSLIVGIWTGIGLHFYFKYTDAHKLLTSLTRTAICETSENFLNECMRLHEITLHNQQDCLAKHKQCIAEQNQFTATLENCTNILDNQLQKEQNRLIQFKEIERGWLAERAALIKELTECLETADTSESRSD